jgi:hypothetical protein
MHGGKDLPSHSGPLVEQDPKPAKLILEAFLKALVRGVSRRDLFLHFRHVRTSLAWLHSRQSAGFPSVGAFKLIWQIAALWF